MDILVMVLVAGATLGLCFLVDKGFTKWFRSAQQHKSGQAVRYGKRTAAVGVVLAALGVAAIVYGVTDGWILIAGGSVLVLMGAFLVARYATFGVYYDDEGFLLSAFGKKSVPYRYEQILGQQLYSQYGGILIELHMDDGRAFQLPMNLEKTEAFLNRAFEKWCEQKGLDPQQQSFHNPDNSCWFPGMEG